MNRIHHTSILLAVVLCTAAVVVAQSDPAFDAYNAGDFDRAFELWMVQAESGNANSQTNVGLMYEAGQGVSQNLEEAFRWYSLAAEAGLARAQCAVAYLYAGGRGVALDHSQAVSYFAKCARPGRKGGEVRATQALQYYAEHEFPEAQYALARVYADGRLVERNDEIAASWFEEAAEHGHADAQLFLADIYFEGKGVPADASTGEQWLFRALLGSVHDDGTWPSASLSLALKYHRDTHDSTDAWIKAYVWADIGAYTSPDGATGLKAAMFQETKKLAKAAMTTSQLAKAKDLAATWRDLFQRGLPDVTIENLRTLTPPSANTGG